MAGVCAPEISGFKKVSGKLKIVLPKFSSSEGKNEIMDFFAQNKFHVLCKNELECNQKLSALDLKHGFAVYDKNSFKQYVKQHGLHDVVLIYGFENFWRVIADGIY